MSAFVLSSLFTFNLGNLRALLAFGRGKEMLKQLAELLGLCPCEPDHVIVLVGNRPMIATVVTMSGKSQFVVVHLVYVDTQPEICMQRRTKTDPL